MSINVTVNVCTVLTVSESLCANLMVSIYVFVRFTLSFGLSTNIMVSFSLSGHPAMSVNVSVSVRDTISRFYLTVCPDVICPHCKHGVEYKTDHYGCKVCVCKPYGE